MFNLLVSGVESAWESGQRMSMEASRFGEHSGDEFEAISLNDPESLKKLEQAQSLLMYEDILRGPHADVVRVGQMRRIRVSGRDVTFRFAESGRIARDGVHAMQHRLQMTNWERSHTHWAIKDGTIPQGLLSDMVPTLKTYDVVLSFAGEDREYVEQVAELLADRGVDFFYDKYEAANLWGKDLVEHFESIYRKQSRFCVMFISKHYADKVWPKQERRAALARAMEERLEYVLPARFDDTELPGLLPSIVYQDLRELSPEQLTELILEKLGRH